MPLPKNVDRDKLAILSLSMHGEDGVPRVWKALDWEIMDLLFANGWISDPKSKAQSVDLTEDGKRQAQESLEEFFKEPEVNKEE